MLCASAAAGAQWRTALAAPAPCHQLRQRQRLVGRRWQNASLLGVPGLTAPEDALTLVELSTADSEQWLCSGATSQHPTAAGAVTAVHARAHSCSCNCTSSAREDEEQGCVHAVRHMHEYQSEGHPHICV